MHFKSRRVSAIWCRRKIILLNIFSACLCASLSCHSCSRVWKRFCSSWNLFLLIFFARLFFSHFHNTRQQKRKTLADVIFAAKKIKTIVCLRKVFIPKLALCEVFHGKIANWKSFWMLSWREDGEKSLIYIPFSQCSSYLTLLFTQARWLCLEIFTAFYLMFFFWLADGFVTQFLDFSKWWVVSYR